MGPPSLVEVRALSVPEFLHFGASTWIVPLIWKIFLGVQRNEEPPSLHLRLEKVASIGTYALLLNELIFILLVCYVIFEH